MADDDTERSTVVSDILIDILYAVVIGVNVYVIVDQATDGALSRSMSLRVQRVRHRAATWAQHRKEYRRDVGHMFWQATTTLEGEPPSE